MKMQEARKILVVFPHNFFELKSGVHKRFYEFVSCLKALGFEIDLLGLRHFESNWNNFKTENDRHLVNRLFLYDFRTGYHWRLVMNFFSKMFPFSKTKVSGIDSPLPDYAFHGMQSLLAKITGTSRYDYIVIGYVYWANLLQTNLPQGITRVLTMEDFISLKVHEANPGNVNLDAAIAEEIKRVNLFDRVICLSDEELRFFSANAPHPGYDYVPVFMEKPARLACDKVYDILFIGFDNPENIEGLKWFFQQVRPHLKDDLKILVVGKVSLFVADMAGVTKTEYAPRLDEAYGKCRITINPLQSGTGMKVKVVESLAYGIPMVNTPKGLCGMPPELLKEFLVAGDPQLFAAEIRHLLTDPEFYSFHCLAAEKIFSDHFEAGIMRKKLEAIFK